MFWPPLNESLAYETINVTTASEERSNIKETRKFQIFHDNVKIFYLIPKFLLVLYSMYDT